MLVSKGLAQLSAFVALVAFEEVVRRGGLGSKAKSGNSGKPDGGGGVQIVFHGVFFFFLLLFCFLKWRGPINKTTLFVFIYFLFHWCQ